MTEPQQKKRKSIVDKQDQKRLFDEALLDFANKWIKSKHHWSEYKKKVKPLGGWCKHCNLVKFPDQECSMCSECEDCYAGLRDGNRVNLVDINTYERKTVCKKCFKRDILEYEGQGWEATES